MLLQFSFSNFKSFRDENTLNMEAASIKEHQEHLIEKNKNEKYLKLAAIHGANASGKSNVVEAMKYMRYIIFNSFSKAIEWDSILTKKFKFNEESKKGNSLFEVFFTVEDIEYQYGFEINEKEIFEEWLYEKKIDEKKDSLVFFREKDKIELSKEIENYRVILNTVKEKTLLLSFLANLNINNIKNVYDWFKNTEILDYGNSMEELIRNQRIPIKEIEDIESYERLKNFLKNIDIGIEEIRIEKTIENEKPKYKVFSIHYNNDSGLKEELPLEEESQGTLKMIALYRSLINTLDNGRTLFIDELDAKLHSLLVKYIIKLFSSEKTNPKNAQLIFTTHDITNLTKENFRRDEIWFVEKEKESNTSNLYSLIDFKLENGNKVRNDASYGKNYLYGIYGGVPILKDYIDSKIGGENIG